MCAIEVNWDTIATAIDSLGSYLLIWMAGGIASQTTWCLVTCLKSCGFHSLTYHAVPSPEAFAAFYPGLVDVALFRRSLLTWMLVEGAVILNVFAKLPLNNSAKPLTVDTARRRPYLPDGVSSLNDHVRHHVNSDHLGGKQPKQLQHVGRRNTTPPGHFPFLPPSPHLSDPSVPTWITAARNRSAAPSTISHTTSSSMPSTAGTSVSTNTNTNGIMMGFGEAMLLMVQAIKDAVLTNTTAVAGRCHALTKFRQNGLTGTVPSSERWK